jgi:signal transduction histidine kinase/DNA-binding NarL/FixJ family response regulator
MKKPLRLLLIEDSEDDAELVLAELRLGDYEPVYERVDTSEGVTAALQNQSWDIILSDYSMPRFSAPAALELLRATMLDIPFIIVSGAIGEAIAVAAMKQGAHDYILKGSLSRLIPAIERELREAEVRRERQKIEEANRGNLRRIRVLHEINMAIASTLDLRTVLEILLDKIDLVVSYTAISVRLFNHKSGLLEPLASRNLDQDEWKLGPWSPGRGLANLVFDTKTSLIIDNLQVDSRVRNRDFFRNHGFVSYLGVPLVVKEENLGVLSFYMKKEHKFVDEEVDFLSTLASQAAMAIHNAQLYEQIQHQAIALKRSNKVKDEFLSVMSHELKTPLNLVLGYAEVMKNRTFGDITAEQETSLEKILNHGNDLLRMISSILCVTNIEANQIQTESCSFSLSEFLLELQLIFKASEAKHARLIWDFPSDLPSMQTDKDKLKQILQHLIHNAIKFTGNGEVTVSAKVKHAVENRTRNNAQNHEDKLVEFKVTDTGIGISEEKLPIIFEMFRQVDSSGTRNHEGVGLGLYIAKHFTELLGGNIEVQTAINEGSTFAVTIPLLTHPIKGKGTDDNKEIGLESNHVSHSGSNLSTRGLQER